MAAQVVVTVVELYLILRFRTSNIYLLVDDDRLCCYMLGESASGLPSHVLNHIL